jgi:hypothetical protein
LSSATGQRVQLLEVEVRKTHHRIFFPPHFAVFYRLSSGSRVLPNRHAHPTITDGILSHTGWPVYNCPRSKYPIGIRRQLLL